MEYKLLKKHNLAMLVSVVAALSAGGCATTDLGGGKAVPAATLPQSLLARIAASQPARAGIGDGIRLLRAGQWEDANRVFEHGLKLNPGDGTLHFLNALAYHLRAGDGNQATLELAETGYRLALKFEPDNVWAAYLLGYIAHLSQRYGDAQEFFSYGILYHPDQPHLLQGLLVSSYANKDLGMAAWAARRLEAAPPDSPSVRRNAALTYAAVGDFVGARASLASFSAQNGGDALNRRVAEWEGFYRRNDLPQLAFSDAAPFESRKKARDDAKQNILPDNTLLTPVASPERSTGSGGPTTAMPGTAAKGGAAPVPELGPKMALVDVVIIRTEENRSSSRGVNLLSGLRATLGGTLYEATLTSSYTNGQATRSRQYTFNPVLSLAGLTYNLNIFNDGSERAEIIARPSLLAVENKTSKFFSGGVWHVQLSGNLTYGSVEEVPIGLTLKVTPQFLNDELLVINVDAERSFLESRSEDVGFTAFSETTKTSVQASAKLRFGETLILSGLSENESNRSRDGVPVLERLPVIQYLFSNKIEQDTHRSVLILLTPRKPRFLSAVPDAAAAGAETAQRPEGSAFREQLQKKEGIRGNIDATLAGLVHSDYYRQFRSGDMQVEDWRENDGLGRILGSFLSTIYF